MLLLELSRALLIMGAAWGCDWLLRQLYSRARRWSTQYLRPSEQLWVELGLGSLYGLLRFSIWAIAILGVVQAITVFAPLHQWLTQQLQQVPDRIWRGVSQPMEFGQARLSLRDALGALVATIAIFIGSRLLGQWLKQWVLRRTRVELGMQEAIATLATYAVALLGITILMGTLGLDMSSLTVLAGVIGLGFGLGLQELASNFVSGLTLLFEQQLRVGDFVEVDGLMGTIERISIRSTILRTTDRQFVIVPNHRFSQNNVVNWSYQTPQTRLHIPVSVAFGSDTVLVTETLLVAARLEPRVLTFPAPSVWFKAFGDSAYLFELLVWIDRPQDHEPIKSALNFLVEQELRQQSIEIPFPQRQLHLKQRIFGAPAAWTTDRTTPTDPSEAVSGEAKALEFAPTHPGQPQSLRVLLREVSYFSQCSDPQLRMLIEQGYQRSFRAGQVICEEGQAGNSFYIILAGRVAVQSATLDREIATLGRSNFFGEISLFTGMPRSATVRAIADTITFVVDHQALQHLLQEYRELAEHIAHALAQRQQVLRELGLLDPSTALYGSEAPFDWIRQRIQTLFGI